MGARVAWLANLRDAHSGRGAAGRTLARAFGAALAAALARRLAAPNVIGQADAAPTQTDAKSCSSSTRSRNYFEHRECARDARRVLEAAGYAVHADAMPGEARPLCCGRTFLAAGLVDEAKAEARRTLAALVPLRAARRRDRRARAVVPARLRDEFLSYGPGRGCAALVARHAMLFEEFLVREQRGRRLTLAA